MTKPRVTFGKAGKLMRDYLRPLLVARAESYAPNTATADYPVPPLTSGTHLQIQDEAGNTDDYPVTERCQVRFTVWAPKGKGVDAQDAASLVMAYVYALEGVAGIAGTQILGGRSDVVTDPQTQYEMCWFLARVNLKATSLAS